MHGNKVDSRATTPPHPSFTYSLPAPSEPSPFGRRKSSFDRFFRHARGISQPPVDFLHSVLRPPLLMHARTLCVKPARIHLASPTLTQEHSADHRPMPIASKVRHRSHVGANALSRAIAEVAA